MIVAQYWAEARQQHRAAGKQITVRRFGWSDTSETAAQVHAEQRVAQAMMRLQAGSKEPRRERKMPYNGADGMPIREEIVGRHGSAVITRNSYGARCLNTPDVLFADIDLTPPVAGAQAWRLFWVLVAIAVVMGVLARSILLTAALGLLAALLSGPLAIRWKQRAIAARGGAEHLALTRVDEFMAKHPEWGARLYRTPAGFRLLATHRTFSPGEPAVGRAFSDLGADPLFALMCARQNCFRARVSPKPWRMGFSDRLRPRPGVWPIAVDKLPMRQQWVEAYEAAATSFAACRFIKAMGAAMVHGDVLATQQLHDQLCRADTSLPIA
jgi:hypothetical protein